MLYITIFRPCLILKSIFLHVDGLLFLGQSDVYRGRLQVLMPQDFFDGQDVGAHSVVVGGHGVS